MAISRLTSRENSLLKTIRLVSSGSRRAPAGLVVAEGSRVLNDVNACGCAVKAVIVSEEFGASKTEASLLQGWLSKNIRVCRTSEQIFQSVSDLRSPQGAIALIAIPEQTLDEVIPKQNPLVIFACGIQDPGNMGTIIRAAAAAGASLICIGQETVSPRNTKSIRASAGAFFRIPIVEHIDMDHFLTFCESHSIKVYRTDVRRGMPHTNADLKSACAVILGNEGSGLQADSCAGLPAIRIPMAGDVESLNVAMAGSIILFEALRQRSSQ